MITAKTKNGTLCVVSFVADVEPNVGGWYCQVERKENDYQLDDFCIHPNDCDCTNMQEVETFAREYVENITEY